MNLLARPATRMNWRFGVFKIIVLCLAIRRGVYFADLRRPVLLVVCAGSSSPASWPPFRGFER